MKKKMFCEECHDEAEDYDGTLFSYRGQGDWVCEKGHVVPDDAFGYFCVEGNETGPFIVHLQVDELSVVRGRIQAHDSTGVAMDTCLVVEDGASRFEPCLFIPWVRVRYVGLLSDAEEKLYREKTRIGG